MSKEKVAYVIINPEGKKLWPMLRYREKDCIKFFLSAAMSVTKKARNWKYWRDKKRLSSQATIPQRQAGGRTLLQRVPRVWRLKMAKQKEMSTWIVKVWKLEKYEVEAKTRTEAL